MYMMPFEASKLSTGVFADDAMMVYTGYKHTSTLVRANPYIHALPSSILT